MFNKLKILSKMKIKNLFAVAALLMCSTSAFADKDVTIVGNVVVSETTGQTYTPVVDGKAPLAYTITGVKASDDGKTFKSGTVSVKANGDQIKGYTSISIPGSVKIPVTITSGAPSGTYDFAVTEVEYSAFPSTYADKLESVTFGGNVEIIGASAFNGVKTLTSATFGAKVTNIGYAAFYGTKLSELTLPNTLVTIDGYAFAASSEAYPTFSAVAIPAKVEYIGASAFEGCENLATVTVSEGSWLYAIGSGAFAYTSIQTLDLSNALAYDYDPKDLIPAQGMTAISNPIFTSYSHTTNGMIKKVVLPTTCTLIATEAFKDCVNLNEIDLSNVKQIDDDAFKNCKKLTAATIGTTAKFETGKGIVLGDNIFDGTAVATVELGKISTSSTIGDDAFKTCAKLTTFKFNEIEATLSTAAFNLATVTTVDFQKYVESGAVAASTFTNAFAKGGTVNYNIEIPTGKPATTFIDVEAFSTDAGASRTITLNTIQKIQTAYGSAEAINKVKIAGDFSGAKTFGMLKDANSKNYYYYFKAEGSNYSIAKTNENDASVIVYQAYVDEKDQKLYFMPLQSINGKFIVEAGETVIVKSNKEDAVKALPTADPNTMAYDVNYDIINGLDKTDAAVSLLKVQTDAKYMDNGNKDLFFMNNPSTSGFGFTKFDPAKQTGGLGKNAVFITCKASSAARLDIVWLDEEATAIQTVKKVSENGAIYNLRGEKVNASYKGIVIKDGKKYIQK
jgi:hypothetical protein